MSRALELRPGCSKRVVLTIHTPRRIPLDFSDPDTDAEAVMKDRVCREVLMSSASAWSDASDCKDVERMWQLWCHDTEEYLCVRATMAGDCIHHRLVRGRGVVKFVKRMLGLAQDAADVLVLSRLTSLVS